MIKAVTSNSQLNIFSLAPSRSSGFYVGHKQCNQIGWFLKNIIKKFAYKSSVKRLVTFGIFWNRLIYVKNVGDIIMATFGNIWATFLFQHLVTLASNVLNPWLSNIKNFLNFLELFGAVKYPKNRSKLCLEEIFWGKIHRISRVCRITQPAFLSITVFDI